MKRTVFLALLATLATVTSCELITPGEPEASGPKGTFKMAIPMQQVVSLVARMEGVLRSANGTVQTFPFVIAGDTARAIVQDLATGSWRLTVNAYGADESLRFTGSSDVSIQPGQVTRVNLVLSPPSGSLEITAVWNVPAQAKLLLHLPFDGTNADVSGRGRAATIVGATYGEDRFGTPGKSLKLDGVDDYAFLAPDSALNKYQHLTVMAWVFFPETIKPNCVFNNAYVDNKYSGLLFNITPDGRGNLMAGNADHIGVNARINFLTGPSVVLPGRWTHVTWVFTSLNYMRVLINGYDVQGVIQGNGDALRYAPGGKPVIGMYDGSNYPDDVFEFMRGSIDDLRVYDGSLSAAQVREAMGALAAIPVTR